MKDKKRLKIISTGKILESIYQQKGIKGVKESPLFRGLKDEDKEMVLRGLRILNIDDLSSLAYFEIVNKNLTKAFDLLHIAEKEYKSLIEDEIKARREVSCLNYLGVCLERLAQNLEDYVN